jgi:hypothetical protein
METLLCQAGLAKLDEIRKFNSTKLAIRIVTNADHPFRPYFTNPINLDVYAMWPRNPKPLLIRTGEHLGETQIDISKIEMSSRYNRPPWKPVNEKQFDVRLSAFRPGTSSERYMTETARTLDKDYDKHVKIYTHGSYSMKRTVFNYFFAKTVEQQNFSIFKFRTIMRCPRKRCKKNSSKKVN